MACQECYGTGFVVRRRSYKSRFTGNEYPGAMVAVRCPLYAEYFEEVKDPLLQKPIYADGLCSAASIQHEAIRDRANSNGKGKAGKGV